MFEGLDVDRIETGYLIDKAVEYADVRLFDGVLREDNISDISIFRNVIATISSASINSIGDTYNADLASDYLTSNEYVNIGIALFKYDYIVSNALSDGLINYQNGVVSDVTEDGVWKNPYNQGKLFVFTPSTPGKSGFDVRFKFDSSNIYTNLCINKIEFDAGSGYRTISSQCDTTVCFNSEGKKTLRLRVTLDDYSILESHCFFYVYSPPVATSSSSFSLTYSGVHKLNDKPYVAATVSFLSAHDGKVKAPLVYVEGFDDKLLGLFTSSSNSLSVTDTSAVVGLLCDWINNGFYHAIKNLEPSEHFGAFGFDSFYDKLDQNIRDNYDIFYVDWHNPEVDIRDNAELLVEIIKWLNLLKDENSARNIIVGHSMGGLITRYALRKMEIGGIQHQTDCYVSYDTPQLGVNVPIGLQYALRDIIKILYGYSYNNLYEVGILHIHLADPVISYIYSMLSCPSAKQMMYYYVNADDECTCSDHQLWQNELDSMGFPYGDPGYPISNLSIVNGGAAPYVPNSKICTLDVSIGQNAPSELSDFRLALLICSLFYTNNVGINMRVYKDNGNSVPVYFGAAYYIKFWSWKGNSITYPLLGRATNPSVTRNSPQGSPGYDSVISSYILPEDFCVGPWANGADTIKFNYYPPIYFVPQASALAISKVDASKYRYNYYSNPPIPKDETPFESYFINQYSQPHENNDEYYWNWVVHQNNLSLAGPDNFVLTGDSYTIEGVPPDYNNPDWSMSSSNLTISNGSVTVNFAGRMASVIYKNNGNNGAFLYKQKRVLAGFPAMNLSAERISGDSYMVSADCVLTDSELRAQVQKLTSSGELKYIWGYKNSDNSYNWSDTTSVNYHTFTAPQSTTTHVCMKLYNGLGRESNVSVYDIVRQSDIPYYIDPAEIMVNELGYSMNYQYVNGLSASKYLAVWCNPNYVGTAQVPDSVEVGGVYYPVVSTLYRTVNGDPVTIYCFDIKNNQALQNTISAVRNGNELGLSLYGISIKIRSGGMTLQNNILPIVSRTLPVIDVPVQF